MICTGQRGCSLYANVNDCSWCPSLSVSYGYTQLGRGSKGVLQAPAWTLVVFPVANQSYLVSSDVLHQSHAQNFFPVVDKPQ